MASNAPVLGEDVVHHGVSLSKRMDASLEILHLLHPEDADIGAQSFQTVAAQLHLLANAVAYKQLLGAGDFSQEVVDYCQERRDLLCVILSPAAVDAEATRGKRHRKFKEVSQLLSCPVVLYTASMRCNVKVLIGITQDLDSAKKALISHHKGLGAATEVGPFKSREEAEKWKNFMMARRDNYEEIVQQASGGQEGQWFGFTVESPKDH
ncbi:MAG: hypothetical protein RI601_06555 [Desulfurivibrionaceae bacterium]|nr:hypothetical protein [Desulfurivibrionaceae bacterium]